MIATLDGAVTRVAYLGSTLYPRTHEGTRLRQYSQTFSLAEADWASETASHGPSGYRESGGNMRRQIAVLWNCCASTTLSQFSCETRHVPEFGLGGEASRFRSRPRGTAMGETLLLLSCGAAFITGIVIAAASLFGG